MLEGSFIVRTDHNILKYLLEQKISTPAQQKWFSKLLAYDCSVEYKKGVENKMADALSRRGENEDDAVLLAITVPNPIWLEEIKRAYARDQVVQ